MRALHEGKYDNLFYLETEESIMTALEMSDLVVSDESSVMTEALMYNKPSIAFYDWLIHDTEPSRWVTVPIDYVYKCKKVELRESVEKFVKGELDLSFMSNRSVFTNAGNVNKDIMDAIEYYLYDGEKTDFMKWKISDKSKNIDRM